MSPLKLLASSLIVLCVTGFVLCYFEIGSEVAAGVNKEDLLKIRPDLTEQEVLRLIGSPLEKRRRYPPHPIGEKPKWEGHTSWIYGEPGYCQGGLEISVGVQNGRVLRVGIELYDLGVYMCNQEQCPVVWDAEALNRLPSRNLHQTPQP